MLLTIYYAKIAIFVSSFKKITEQKMTFDFIPLDFYTPLYHHIILLVTLFTFIELHVRGYTKNKYLGLILLTFVVAFLGFRPLSGKFLEI